MNRTVSLNQIRHIFINLEQNPTENEVLKSLQKSFELLDLELDFQSAQELFDLILNCFSHKSDQPKSIFDELLRKSRSNSNFIIATTSILYYLNQQNKNYPNSSFQIFIDESFNQTFDQIKKTDNDNLIIFNKVIPKQFKANYIIEIILLAKLKKSQVNDLYDYIFSHVNILQIFKVRKFFSKLAFNGFLALLPTQWLLNDDLLKFFQFKTMATTISKMPENEFKELLPKIEEYHNKPEKYDYSISITLLNKIIEYNLDFSLIDIILNNIMPTNLEEHVWKYLFDHNITIPIKLAEKITDFPDPVLALKIFPKFTMIPKDVYETALFSLKDLNDYIGILDPNNLIDSEIYSSPNFWAHLVSIASESKIHCYDSFINLFNKSVKKEKMVDVINEMVFKNYPTTKSSNTFLFRLFEKNEEFHSNEIMNWLFQKTLDQKVLPDLTFWKLFDFNYIDQKLKLENSDPYVLCAYIFSSTNIDFYEFKSIEIKPQKNPESSEQIIDFIQNFDINKINNLNEEALSLVICSLIFLLNKEKPEVKGLNENLILPFYAIGFVCHQKVRYNTTFCDSPVLSQSLLNAFKNLSKKQSLLSTISIDAILSNISVFLCPTFFPRKSAIQILDVLFSHITSGLYKADRFTLLQSFFVLVNNADHDEEIKVSFNKHATKIIRYIIYNLNKINNANSLKQNRLNLAVLESDEIKKVLIDKIENNSSSVSLINTITFIEKYCQNVPPLSITYPTNLIRLLNAAIAKNDWDNLYLIGNFMKNNKISVAFGDIDIKLIPFQIREILFGIASIELNELISIVLADDNPENQTLVFEYIFKKLMNNRSIALNYFIYAFERIGHKHSIAPFEILKYFSKEYNQYGDLFVKALSIVYSFHPYAGMFIRNPIIKMPLLSKSNISLVLNLLSKASDKNANFQVFFCLHEIASSFPFLFSKNAAQVFKVTFLKFDTSLVKYMACKEGNINEFKQSFYAFLFLIKCLFSIDILNKFIPWCVENIINFNESQIYIFVFIMEFLLTIKSVCKIVYALIIKFKLLDVLADFLNRKMNEDLIFSFKRSIYNIILIFTFVLIKKKIVKLIYLDELSNLNNQFVISYGNFNSIYFHYWRSYCLHDESTSIKKISHFFTSTATNKKYFLSYENQIDVVEPNRSDVDNFVIHFVDFFQPYLNIDDNKPIELPNNMHFYVTGFIRYLASQPKYIYSLIVNRKSFPYLPKHFDIINKVVDDLNQFKNKTRDDVNFFSPNISAFLSRPICNDKLFNLIVKEAFNDNTNLDSEIIDIIYYISNVKATFICFLKQFNDFLSKKRNSNINFKRLSFIIHDLRYQCEFKEHFIEYCGYNFVEISLLPENRKNTNFLFYTIKLLLSSNSCLPSNVNYLISFLLIQKKKDLMLTALNLCEKVGENNLTNIMPTIESIFDYVFKELKDTSLICLFLSIIPSLGKYRETNVISLLNVLAKNYKNENNNAEICESICIIFNSLSPNKNFKLLKSNRKKIPSPSASNWLSESTSAIDGFILGQPSSNVLENDQKFWQLYQTYRVTINEIVVNDNSMLAIMKFLFNFPGLLSFKRRIYYFKEQLKSIINYDNKIPVKIHRNNIFLESFDILHQLDPYEIKRKIQITFLGENGLDYGGLTREWFTLIVQEIFKENNKLFIRTDNNNYQPNPNSNEIENHLEKFKFVGIIIALAIINDQYVNAHFTRSFYKQILNFSINFRDLEDYDETLYNSLNYYLENDVEPFELNFTISVPKNGEIETILLKEKGDEIIVTNKNKNEFVNLYAYYHLKAAIKEQIDAFREGFYSIIPLEKIIYFSPVEFDLLICGIPVIDVNDLKENTVYQDPYFEDHPTIKLFFDTISEWDNDNLAKLLLFITGSSKVPVNGFVEYKNNENPINIIPGGNKKRFCVAHTCSNTLALPYYETKDEMNNKLLISIQQTEFGLL